jgi:hypothetical protein
MRIVKGKLVLAEPNPNMLQILKSEIDGGRKFKVNNLFKTSKRQYYGLPGRRQFAQVFFYWLNQTGQMPQYLANAQQKGYDLEVLEETIANSWGKINKELAVFVEENAPAAARLHDARQAKDHAQRQQAFLKVLEIKPDHQAARLELAQCYYRSKNYENCRKHLNQILNDPQSAEFLPAATLMAHTYYKQEDHTNALEYYNKAWEYSDCYEYKYKVAYQIAYCYESLENKKCATQAYKNYLDYNWEPEKTEKTAKAVKRARDYIEVHGYDPDKIK